MDENELVNRLRLNNVDAFDTLYHKYHHAIYYNVLKLTRDTTTSEDIVQEVFTSLWENRMVIDPAKSISGWLFVVSYNKSVSFLKKTLRESVVCNENAGMKYSNELEVNFRETQSILLKEAINKLSPQKRKVLELCKLEGKSYDETAKELRISKHTVKEYLSAAISYIKHDIQKHPNYHSTVVHITILSLLLRF